MSIVKLKRSAVANKVPLTTDLDLGELAVNTFDGNLFFKKDPGTQSIVTVATLEGAQTVSGAKTFTGGTYFNEVVVRASSTSEGGQIVLGYANNTTATGQGNNTWIIDVQDFANQKLRFFRINSSGVVDIPIEIPDAGAITINRSLTLGPNGISANGTFGSAGQVLATNGSAVYWAPASGGGGTNATNLTYSANSSTITVFSDTGTDAVVLAASSTVAGVMTATAQTIGGAKTFTGDITADRVVTANNGAGTNFQVGDDSWIGDINVANTLRITGQQDPTQGFIVFGNSNNTALGRSGTGALTYGGNAIILASDIGTVTSTMIANNSIIDADINSSAAIAITKLAASTISGVSLGNNLNTLTIGTGLSGTSYNGSAGVTVAIDSTVATLTGTQTLTNKTISSGTLTGTLTANGSVGTAGQVLTSNATGTYWSTVSGGGGGGATDLDSLTDVAISAVSAGDILRYDGTNWVNDVEQGIRTGKAIAMAIVFG